MSCSNQTAIQKFVVYHLLFFFILTPFLASCGGSGSSSDNNTPTDLTEEEIVASAVEDQNRSAMTAISQTVEMITAMDNARNLIEDTFGSLNPTGAEIEAYAQNSIEDAEDLFKQIDTELDKVRQAADSLVESIEEMEEMEDTISGSLYGNEGAASQEQTRNMQLTGLECALVAAGILGAFMGFGLAVAEKSRASEYNSTWGENLKKIISDTGESIEEGAKAAVTSVAATLGSLASGAYEYKTVKFICDVVGIADNVQTARKGAIAIRSCEVSTSGDSEDMSLRKSMATDYESLTDEDIYVGVPDENGYFHNVPAGEWTFVVFVDGYLRTVTDCINAGSDAPDTIEVEITPVPIETIGDLLENIPDETEVDENGSDTNTVTDYDGNVYSTITITDPVLMVDKVWMAENLKTTHYSDGTPLVSGMGLGEIDENNTTKYWFVTQDRYSNKEKYGLLYTWTAAMNGAPSSDANPSGVQGICPNGWHLPSSDEWSQKTRSIDMERCDQILPDSYDISIPMQFAGYRTHMGMYESVGDLGFFWTTEVGSCGGESAGSLYFDKYNSGITTCGSCDKKVKGLSVRCVKD